MLESDGGRGVGVGSAGHCHLVFPATGVAVESLGDLQSGAPNSSLSTINGYKRNYP